MSLKSNSKLLIDDLLFKNGFNSFLCATITSIFILFIWGLLIVSVIKGTLDLLAFGAGLALVFFILSNFGRDKKIEELEKTIHDDKIKINELSQKNKEIDVDKINRQMKDMEAE